LFFLAFIRDPRTHFIPMQTRLGLGDGLSEYIQHTGSALFAIPRGIAEGGYLGQALFS
jgi:deferrochelatase/peroxidase EfeB